MARQVWICEICKTPSQSSEEAQNCENHHINRSENVKISIISWRGSWSMTVKDSYPEIEDRDFPNQLRIEFNDGSWALYNRSFVGWDMKEAAKRKIEKQEKENHQ